MFYALTKPLKAVVRKNCQIPFRPPDIIRVGSKAGTALKINEKRPPTENLCTLVPNKPNSGTIFQISLKLTKLPPFVFNLWH